jgi:acetyl esterase/lipase
MTEPSMRDVMRATLSRPAATLVAESGGAPLVVGGRKLDAHFQFLAAQARASADPNAPVPTPAESRAQVDAMPMLFGGDPEPGVAAVDLQIPAAGRSIPARAYRPDGQDPAQPLIVFYHFGGGVVGSIETCHCFCTMLAKACSAPVLSIDYRLAPEHRFPAGIDDAIEAYEWGAAHAAEFGAPAGKAAVGGDSMGGNFAAIVCQDMKRKGAPQPVAQLLIYPALDVASQYESMRIYAEAFPLTAAAMAWFMAHYMSPGDDANNPKLSPLRAADLSGLAPALIYCAGHDPLADEGPAYAQKLRAAGADATFVMFDELAHAFTVFTGVAPAADAACRRIAAELNAALRKAR